MRLFSASLLAGAALSATARSATLSQDDIARLKTMDWRSGVIALPKSQSHVGTLPNSFIITGQQAIEAQTIENAQLDQAVEAETIDKATSSETVYSFFSSGYVKDDDWKQVDATSFLDQIRQKTVDGNNQRYAKGQPGLIVDGWVQRPELDARSHVVSWVIALHLTTGKSLINAVALQLGRYGVEKITYIDSAANTAAAASNLRAVTEEHQFDAGAGFTDFNAGTDRAAEFGVAGLVAGVLGVKLLNVAAAGGAALLLKKAGALIILPFIWLWRKVRRSRKSLRPNT